MLPSSVSLVLRRVAVVAATACATAGVAAVPAQAHGTPAATKSGERRLRAVETATLGAAHAAEHARERAALRDPARRAAMRRARRAARRAVRARAAAAPSVDGAWADPFAIRTVAIHAALLPTGKVLWFGRPTTAGGMFQASLWDPATGRTTQVDPPRGADGELLNIFCAGQSFLADGRLLVTGGNLADGTGSSRYKGLDTVLTFNPYDETWTQQPSLEHGRWYPTQVLQVDGRTVIMDGLDESGTPGVPHNDDIEVFTPSPDLNGVGTVTKLDGRRGTQGAAPTGELYPHMLLMPSGRTFVAGPNQQDSWFLNPFGAAKTYTWSDAKNPLLDHYYGGGVILPSDTPGSTEVELVGGANGATTGDVTADATNEIFDEAAPAAGWRRAPSLSVARAHHNTVLLPDGSMVAVGGGLGEVAGDLSRFTADQLSVDLWDPRTRAWHRGPSQQEARAYHSTALLLPDGRVISAGDDANGGGRQADTAEIYSPAYLFDGPRPVITGAPGTLAYGGGAQVAYAGSDVARAVLVAPGATTHANDMNQRFVPLSITGRGAGTVELAAPSGPTIAPPGVYMLFLLNDRGVPSVARFVRVGAAGTPPVVVGPGTGGTGAGGGGPATPPPGAQPALLTSGAPARASLARVRSRGLSVPYACARSCSVRAELTVGAAVARRVRITRSRTARPVVVGRGSVPFKAGARRGRLTVRLTATARRRLASSRRVTFRLRLVGTDGAGARQTVTRSVTLRR